MHQPFCLCLLLLGSALTAAETPPSPQAVEFFETKVRPVLATHCAGCHGVKKQSASLRLDTREGLFKGADSGPVVVAGQPDKSLLVRVLRHDGDVKMPPKMKLPDAVIADLAAWVKMGAPWPNAPASSSGQLSVAEARQKHWSFQSVRRPAVPDSRSELVRNPIDAFIAERLAAKGLTFSAEADRRTLLRRLHFDLTGLPPTPEDVELVQRDESPDWYEKVVARLLASPAHGERWGRHWLDVARYADSKGYVFTDERRYPFSYTYRDYVVRSLNEDRPYDRMVVEQLAADRLELKDDVRPLAALGFLTLGRRFLNNIHDIIDDRIDVTMRGLQGLTVQCARCHDHKFDPLPARDYYSLYGVFASSIEPKELPVIGGSGPQAAEFQQRLAVLQKDVDEFARKNDDELKKNNRKFRDQLRALQKKVDALKATHPGAPASAMVLVDAQVPTQPYVFLRGNPGNRGETVPRRYLEVIAGPERKPFTQGSGRLELARTITDPDNPLTARVMVNRVWLHHFGEGLVRTPSDFGLRGEPPSHPELLDWLASDFMANGWSIKHLHRLIVTSHTYRQASDERPELTKVDPENRLLGRANRRRLDFEAMRDGLLATANRLDRTLGGPSVDIVAATPSPRRSLYGFIDRQNLPGVFRTFDLASPDAHTPQRHRTTVPQQALFLLNNPFAVEMARGLAGRADVAQLAGPEQRLDRMYRILYGRGAAADEVQLGVKFVEQMSRQDLPRVPYLPAKLTGWEQLAQVLLLSNEFAFVD